MQTFKTTQDKAEYFRQRYSAVVYNAALRDINKVAKATGNKEDKESLKLSAQAALWIAVSEHPEETKFKTLKLATNLFSSWIKDEYNEEILRDRNRKNSTESFTTTPWGTYSGGPEMGKPNFAFVSPVEGPDKYIERELELKQLIKMVDRWISEWGPHTTVWAIARLRNAKGVIDTARKLGFSETELMDTKTKTNIRKIYRILGEIQLELEQNGT